MEDYPAISLSAFGDECWWVPRKHRSDYYRLRAEQAIASGGELIHTAEGVACIEPAPFESSFFKLRMARILWLWSKNNNEQALIKQIKHMALERGWEHLCVRLSSSRQRQIQALEEGGFYMVDIQATLHLDSNLLSLNSRGSEHDFHIGPVLQDDLSVLKLLALNAFRLSRFYADPVLDTQAADKLHVQWFKNNYNGRAAVNLAARVNGEPTGFISCLFHEAKEPIGISPSMGIDLIAVSEATRGIGMGMALVHASLNWFQGKVSGFTVGTQGYNYPALQLYMGIGFKLRTLEATFHILIR